MRYVLNVPKQVQVECATAEAVANIIVDMNLAHNSASVSDRVRELGEADVLRFGTVSVIAIGDTAQFTVQPINTTPLTHTQELPAREEVAAAVVGERLAPQPMTTDKSGRPKLKAGTE